MIPVTRVIQTRPQKRRWTVRARLNGPTKSWMELYDWSGLNCDYSRVPSPSLCNQGWKVCWRPNGLADIRNQ